MGRERLFRPSRRLRFWRRSRRRGGRSQFQNSESCSEFRSLPLIALCTCWKTKGCCNVSPAVTGMSRARDWSGLGLISWRPRSRAPRHAILQSLSQQIGETCNFGVMAGSHAVYLDRVESAWPFGLRFEPGSRVPLHCTSMGKLFLSLLPPSKRALMLRSIPLYRYTENTFTDIGLLEEELEKIHAAGVSLDNQEFLAGVVCVAVPVLGPRKQPVAALAISAPLARMSLQQGIAHIPLLQAAAKQLAATIDDDKVSSE